MTKDQGYRSFVTGGAGFIGAHLVRHLLRTTAGDVTVYDNFSTGRRWAFGSDLEHPRLTIVEGDVKDEASLCQAMAGHHTVYHLASNSDIAQAAEEPDVDFWNGTYLTHNTLEAMRKTGARRIFYTSGSGVYGELDPVPVPEEYPRMIPISTYGASKLAGESLISAYCHMFNLQGLAFRFSNVVGPHQTHGVAYDFLRRLAATPERLKIFGDGSQSKPYIFVTDILRALDTVRDAGLDGFQVFNVSSLDHLTVKDIADIVCERMGLEGVQYDFTGGARGWKADVPVYRLDSSRIRKLGWTNEHNSREAVTAAVDAMLEDLAAGNLTPDVRP
jgi:UDP-glucose 4-epimerase